MTGDIILSSSGENPKTRQQKQNRYRMIVLFISIFLALVAWLYGYFSTGIDVLPFVSELLPGAVQIDVNSRLYIGYGEDGSVVGYAAVGEAPGYAGPIEILVGIDPDGKVIGAKLIQERESPGFFRLIEDADLIGQITGKPMSSNFRLGEDLDGVSGATLSAEGITSATREAIRLTAREGLDTPLPPEKKSIKFGIPEITLLLLYVAGYVGHKMRNRGLKKKIRLGMLFIGMVVLGFIYTAPFTISMVITFLSGYWPDWQNNLYWYLLIGGILFVTTVDAKNPYCSWFCPFGSFQELVSKITNARIYKPRKWRGAFAWLQRGLAFTAVLMGLALRNPGAAGYEPFATLFDLRGTIVQWVFLLIIIFSSLVMYRPFCNYLCPLDPVVDFIGECRRLIIEMRKKW